MITTSVPRDYDGLLALASEKYGVSLRRQTSAKAVGPCPKCGGDDRFVVWLFEGAGTCMRCHHSALFINDDATRAKRTAQSREEKARREQELRAQMADCEDWRGYHQDLLRLDMLGLWQRQGLDREDVMELGLGFCESCPSAPEHQSLTIPVFYLNRLRDIRHKILEPTEETGKYRSHLVGLVPFPFGLDEVFQPTQHIIVVEGEKKQRIVKKAINRPTVGIPGVKLLDDLLLAFSDLAIQLQQERAVRIPEAIVMLDPGAAEDALHIAREIAALGFPASVVDPFAKPDDIVINYGRQPLIEVVRQRRRVR